jgi:hypothetical protein
VQRYRSMTTDPLIRRFNPTGPNYGPSGLDTPGRDKDREYAFLRHDLEVEVRKWQEDEAFGTEQGGGFTGAVSPLPCSPT